MGESNTTRPVSVLGSCQSPSDFQFPRPLPRRFPSRDPAGREPVQRRRRLQPL